MSKLYIKKFVGFASCSEIQDGILHFDCNIFEQNRGDRFALPMFRNTLP